MLSISHKYPQMTPHSSPFRASYGAFFVDPASDWYSASIPVIIYVISETIHVLVQKDYRVITILIFFFRQVKPSSC